MRSAAAQRSFEQEGQRPRPRLELVRPCAGSWGDRSVLRQASGAVSSSIAGGGLKPPAVPNLWAYVITNRSQTTGNGKTGTGDSISAPVANVQTLTDAAAPFAANDKCNRVNIAGSGVGANNGNFWINGPTAITATTLPYINGAGSAEAVYPGTWTLPGQYSQIIDLANARVFANATVQQQPPLVTEFGSFPVAGRLPNTINFLAVTTGASAFETTDLSLCVRFRYSIGTDFFRLTDINDGSSSNRIVFTQRAANLELGWTQGGTTTTLSVASTLAANTWATLGVKLNRTPRTITAYKDGVNVGTSAAGTSRNPTGFVNVAIGNTIVTSPAGTDGFVAAAAFGTSAWSDADFLAVHTSFLAYGVPT